MLVYSSNAFTDKKIFSTVKYGMHLANMAADDIITVDYTNNRTYITAQRPGATYVADVYYDDTGAELASEPVGGGTPGLPIVATGGINPGAIDTVTISNYHIANLGETLWATMDIAFDYVKLVHIAEDTTETVIFHDTFDDATKTVFDYGWQLAAQSGYVTKEGDAIAFLKTNDQAYAPDFYVPMDEAVTSGKFSVSFYTKGESRTPTSVADAAEQVLVAFANKANKKEVYSVTLPAAEKTEYVLVGDTADGSATLYKKTTDGYAVVEGAPTTLAADEGVYKFDAIRMKPTYASNPQTRGAIAVLCGNFDISNEPLTVTACTADTPQVRTDATITATLSNEVDSVPAGAVVTTLGEEEIASEVTLEADDKTITIYYPNGLLYGATYKLTIDGLTGRNLIDLEKYELEFTTEEIPLYISDIKYTDAAGTEVPQSDAVKAQITIENGTGFEAGYTAIVAAYNAAGALIKVYTKPFTLPDGQTTETVDIEGAASLKTLVWKGMDELVPIY